MTRTLVLVVSLGLAGITYAQTIERGVLRFTNPPTVGTPGGYTHLVEARGGRTLYIAGQVGFDRDRTLVGPGDFRAQATQVFENLKAVLAAAGATFDDVVKMNTYVVDMSEIGALREVRASYMGDAKPASTLVQVVRLAREDLLLEIEAMAVVAE